MLKPNRQSHHCDAGSFLRNFEKRVWPFHFITKGPSCGGRKRFEEWTNA